MARIERHGAVISEFRRAPGETGSFSHAQPDYQRSFQAVLIVEAAEKSGALITADCALEQGRMSCRPGKHQQLNQPRLS